MKKYRVVFWVAFAVLFLFAGFYFFKPTQKVEPAKTQASKTQAESLIVKPQIPISKVIVDKAVLDKDSYLVVREIDDGKLSQIVEISSPLKKGIHTDIPIDLGGTDIRGKTLIVMIYDDYNNDGIFNDFDMPSLDENGFMTARFVATGKPIPKTLSESESQSTAMNMPGMKTMAKVHYTDKGFIPNKITVPVGSMVEFINDSSGEMWVASDPHPQHTDLPTFDQFRPFKEHSMYRYVFDKKGTWGFHDHLKASFNGLVTVQ